MRFLGTALAAFLLAAKLASCVVRRPLLSSGFEKPVRDGSH
jgi:hypothetical protein